MAEDNDKDTQNLFGKLIRCMDTIQEHAASDKDMIFNFPKICVVGEQSSGKSSVLTAIIGRDILPSGDEIVTRCPIKVKMQNVKEESEEYASFDAKPGEQFKIEDITKVIYGLQDEYAGKAKGVVNKEIAFTVRLTCCPDLTLMDLPGHVVTKMDGQSETIKEDVQNMLDSYCSDPETVIMAVCDGRKELATQVAIDYSKRHDAGGNRSICIMTKCDLAVGYGETPRVVDCLQNKAGLYMKYGYYAMVNMNQQQKKDGMTLLQVKGEEEKFFKGRFPDYNKGNVLNRTGCNNVTGSLVSLLGERIRGILPDFEKSFKDSKAAAMEALRILPEPLTQKQKDYKLSVYIKNFSMQYRCLFRGDFDPQMETYKLCDADGKEVEPGYFGLQSKIKNYSLYQLALTESEKPTNKPGWNWQKNEQILERQYGGRVGVGGPGFDYQLKRELKDIHLEAYQFLEAQKYLAEQCADCVAYGMCGEFPKLKTFISELAGKCINDCAQKVKDQFENMIDCKKSAFYTANREYIETYDQFLRMHEMKAMQQRLCTYFDVDELSGLQKHGPTYKRTLTKSMSSADNNTDLVKNSSKQIGVSFDTDDIVQKYPAVKVIGDFQPNKYTLQVAGQINLFYTITLQSLRDVLPQLAESNLIVAAGAMLTKEFQAVSDDILTSEDNDYFDLDPAQETRRKKLQEQVRFYEKSLEEIRNVRGVLKLLTMRE